MIGIVEQNYVLEYDGETLQQRLRLYFADVTAADGDPPLSASQNRAASFCAGRFASSGWPHESRNLPLSRGKGHLL